MEIQTVKQNSDLGRLALNVLVNKGFCGPAYSLADLEVNITKMGENFDIDFYDMECFLGPKDKFYNEILTYF